MKLQEDHRGVDLSIGKALSVPLRLLPEVAMVMVIVVLVMVMVVVVMVMLMVILMLIVTFVGDIENYPCNSLE